MLANSSTGVVQDVITDDWCSSCQIDNAVGNLIEENELGSSSLFHLLANERKVGFEVEFVGAHKHRIAAGGLMPLSVDILTREGLLEAIGVDATDLLTVMHEGKAVGIVDADDDILGVTALKIAKGGIGTKGTGVLHIAEQLLILTCHGKGIEGVQGATEICTTQGESSQGTCLAGCLMIIERHTMTEVPVERRNEQGSLLSDDAKDGIEEGIAVKALAIAYSRKHQLHDIGGEQYNIALLQSPVLRQFEITNVRHTCQAWR